MPSIEECIRYRLTRKEIFAYIRGRGVTKQFEIAERVDRTQFLEVWQGLPDLQFDLSKSHGGQRGLSHARGTVYIWITPSVRLALDDDPRTFYIASCRRTPEGIINVDFSWLLEGKTLRDAICTAGLRNQDIMNVIVDKLHAPRRKAAEKARDKALQESEARMLAKARDLHLSSSTND